jgi:hypothetical protein
VGTIAGSWTDGKDPKRLNKELTAGTKQYHTPYHANTLLGTHTGT